MKSTEASLFPLVNLVSTRTREPVWLTSMLTAKGSPFFSASITIASPDPPRISMSPETLLRSSAPDCPTLNVREKCSSSCGKMRGPGSAAAVGNCSEADQQHRHDAARGLKDFWSHCSLSLSARVVVIRSFGIAHFVQDVHRRFALSLSDLVDQRDRILKKAQFLPQRRQ